MSDESTGLQDFCGGLRSCDSDESCDGFVSVSRVAEHLLSGDEVCESDFPDLAVNTRVPLLRLNPHQAHRIRVPLSLQLWAWSMAGGVPPSLYTWLS